MRQTVACCLAALLTMALASQASAQQFIAGSRLIEFCDGTYRGEANANATFYTVCLSYLSATADATVTLASAGAMPDLICLPAGVENERLREVFVRSMREHPEHSELSASNVALNAFRNEWPCN